MNARVKTFLPRVGLGLLAAVVAIQFFRPEKNLSASDSPGELLALHPAPAEVRALFLNACYDCHSNRTRYPWYAEIQPVGWWLAQHVRDGKQELNFSSFGQLSRKRQTSKLEACIDELEAKTMPLPSYTITHHDARLSEAQISALVDWLEETAAKIDAAE
jgi:hypothetical protein